MGVTALLQALKDVVKNAKKKAELKRVMLKVSNAINSAYLDDEDF